MKIYIYKLRRWWRSEWNKIKESILKSQKNYEEMLKNDKLMQ